MAKKNGEEAAPPPPTRIRETKTETGFGGSTGATWERVRDLDPDELPFPGMEPAAEGAEPYDWRPLVTAEGG